MLDLPGLEMAIFAERSFVHCHSVVFESSFEMILLFKKSLSRFTKVSTSNFLWRCCISRRCSGNTESSNQWV